MSCLSFDDIHNDKIYFIRSTLIMDKIKHKHNLHYNYSSGITWQATRKYVR